jgi:UDP-glucose 4-epimerase
MAGRRVLITGVANPFGARLARRLAADAGVERVVGVDTRPVEPALAERIDVVAVDLRSAELPALVHAAAVDTVVHNDIVQFPEPGRPRASLHDINVIGTLQLLTVCEGLATLRAIVVRGSANIYGSEPAAPAFFTEDDAERFPLRTRFQRDIGELERLVGAFARRHPAVVCTVLRLAPVVGRDLDTPVNRLLRAPIVPTVLGYDPRVQLLDADDAVGALHRAVLHPVRGPVNVAGDGVVSLSRALRHARRPALPIAAPLWGTVVGTARRAVRQPALPDEVARYLRFGRGVDTTRMRSELGFTPEHSTLEALARACLERPEADRRDQKSDPPAPDAPRR